MEKENRFAPTQAQKEQWTRITVSEDRLVDERSLTERNLANQIRIEAQRRMNTRGTVFDARTHKQKK